MGKPQIHRTEAAKTPVLRNNIKLVLCYYTAGQNLFNIDIYGDNVEIISSLAEIDEYFSDRDFGERPEVGRFTKRVARSIEDPRMAEEVSGEVCNQAYVTAIKRLGYSDAPLNVAFSRNLAEERGTCFADAFVFGPDGAARIALADWLIEERLHGMYRPGKAPGPAFSKQATKIWHEAKYRNGGLFLQFQCRRIGHACSSVSPRFLSK